VHPTLVFEVVVREGKGETRHHVTMPQEMLERQPRVSIRRSAVWRRLSGFYSTASQRNRSSDAYVTAILRYFPEFEREIPHYLSQS
jgi:hypothetical protein